MRYSPRRALPAAALSALGALGALATVSGGAAAAVTVPAPRPEAVRTPSPGAAVTGANATGTGTGTGTSTGTGTGNTIATGTKPGPQPRQLCGPPYIADKPELGPVYLPRRGLLGSILRGYVPLGGLPPWKFLFRYQDGTTGLYRYPPHFGYATSGGFPNGRPLFTAVTLPAGRKLDRFGGEGGSFLAPFGGSYVGRALPPSNLNTFPAAPEYPCGYHAYRVLKPFRVDAGPASPAFQMRGGGVQYHLLSKYIPEAPQEPAELPVSWLVDNKYLERLYVPV
ncbi:TNT domain-containing protein [Streptosporangium sandarakinum]